MFDKLKKRFVIINMSLLTFVFITIFSVIFVLTAISSERQIDITLHTLMKAPPPAPNNPMAASSIIVDLDKENHIVRIRASWEIQQGNLESAVKIVMGSKTNKTKLKMGDTYYDRFYLFPNG